MSIAPLQTYNLNKKHTYSALGPGDFNIVTSASPSLLSLLHLHFILCEEDMEISVFSSAGPSPPHPLESSFLTIFLSPHCLLKRCFGWSVSYMWITGLFHHLADAKGFKLCLWSWLFSWTRTENGLCRSAAKRGWGGWQNKGWMKFAKTVHYHWTENKSKFNLLQQAHIISLDYHAQLCSSHHTFLYIPVYSIPFIAKDSPKHCILYKLANRLWPFWGKG